MNIGYFGYKVSHNLKSVVDLRVVHFQNSCQSDCCHYQLIPGILAVRSCGSMTNIEISILSVFVS